MVIRALKSSVGRSSLSTRVTHSILPQGDLEKSRLIAKYYMYVSSFISPQLIMNHVSTVLTAQYTKC